MPFNEAPAAARHIDPVAVDASLRRSARLPAAPWLHQEIARRMAERLQVIKLQPKALAEWSGFIGASDGLLAQAYPKARRIIVEPTEALADRTRSVVKSAAWWSPARWTASTVEVVSPGDLLPHSVELLWSNMTLHNAVDPPAVLAQWQRALVVDGFVMFSCLGPDTVRELRGLYGALGWPSPSIDFVDMHDIGDMMVRAGFADPVMDQETLTLTWASPHALLQELRTLGGNASPDRFGGLRGRRWLQQLHGGLAGLANKDGRIALTFEVAYGHAFCAPLRVKGGGETTVSLEQMRAMVQGSLPTMRQR